MKILEWLKSIYIKQETPKMTSTLKLSSTSGAVTTEESITVTATLAEVDVADIGVPIIFSVNGATVGSATTGAHGRADFTIAALNMGINAVEARAGNDVLVSDIIYITRNTKTSTSVSVAGEAQAQTTTAEDSPLSALLKEAQAAEEFVKHGLTTLGAEAEAELVALVKKYR